MTDDFVAKLRDSRYDGQLMMRAKAADRIERLEDQISWLEDKLAAIQYTNLRRDINIKNRTIVIDTICKEKKNDPASTINPKD